MPVMGESSFEAAVQKVMREQNVSRKSAEKIVGSVEQKRARLLKLKLAALKKKRALIANHNHEFIFKGVEIGPYKVASLSQQMGRYAKYWLLNAKQVNGNGWGIAAHTAKENMAKFVGRPLVVTSAKWHGASEYGDKYEHPYLPTNDLNKIFDHQEKFRVGSIVDVQEDRHGDWYATIEMLPKFANFQLPPFCSPAIYQLDAKEDEGAISKWEALHLAALDENPAYGARIALLKGSCVGTANECKVQFKSAKQLNATIYDEDVANTTKKQKKKKMFDKNNPKFRGTMEAQVICPKKVNNIKEKIANLKKKQKVALKIFESGDWDGTLADSLNIISAGGADASKFRKQPTPIPPPTKKYRSLSNSKKNEVLDKVRENLLFNMNENAGEFGFQTYEDTDNLLNFEDKQLDEDLFLGITKGKKIKTKGKGTSLAKLKSKLAIIDVREPFKFAPPKDLPKLHPQSSEIQTHATKLLGTSPTFKGSHFLTTDGKLLGTGKSEHRTMSHNILRTFKDKKFNEMAATADAKTFSRWGTDGRNMNDLLRQTGMSRVSGDDTGINIDAKHPLTSAQRKTILQHITDNGITSDNVFVDDYTPTQGVFKQLRLGSLKSKLAIVRSPDKPQAPREMKHTRVDSAGPLINKVPFGDEDRSTTQQYIDRQMRDSSYELDEGKKVYPPKPTQKDRKRIIKAKLASLDNQKVAYEGGSKYDRQITDLQNNFKGQRGEITKRRPDNLVGRQPENAFGHKCTNEATCGATSGFLGLKLMTNHGLNHKQVKIEGGMYTGPGAEYSSATFKDDTGKPQVGHEWIRLDDGTIIDGSSGQFMNQKNKINQDQRFRVIPPNAPLQKYYKPHYYKNPLIQKRQWYDKNDPLKKSIEKYEKTMRLGKLKAKIASLGEQNMTYQKSKKVVIRKKKNHPKARKAQVEFDDPKAESKLTKISDEAWPTEQSTFLSSTGRFIGGGQDHTETIQKIFPKYTYTPEDKMDDGPVTRFSTQYKLPRVQRRITRAGERISVGIHAPITNAQLKTLQDVEKMGAELGYVVGDIKTGEHGDGFSNMVKALREKKFL